MPELPEVRHRQIGVFTSAQARSAGLSRHQVQHLLSTREIRALRRGVYVEGRGYDTAPPAEQSKARAVAACLAHPDSVISHHSAALIHGLPMLGSRPAVPALTFSSTSARHGDSDRTVIIRSTMLPASQVEGRGAWRVTTPARTICDLARLGPLLHALVPADFSLFQQLATMAELCAVRDGCETWPGIDRLRGTLRLADGRAESPYETVARYQLLQAAIPAIPQVWAYDARGPIGCGDLWLPDLWTFLEIDGDVKYRNQPDVEPLLREKLRQERLEEAGFGVARVSARESTQRDLVTRRVQRAAARGRLARATAAPAGYVASPPPWAERGTPLPLTRPGADLLHPRESGGTTVLRGVRTPPGSRSTTR